MPKPQRDKLGRYQPAVALVDAPVADESEFGRLERQRCDLLSAGPDAFTHDGLGPCVWKRADDRAGERVPRYVRPRTARRIFCDFPRPSSSSSSFSCAIDTPLPSRVWTAEKQRRRRPRFKGQRYLPAVVVRGHPGSIPGVPKCWAPGCLVTPAFDHSGL